jgi:hypothetical protein
MVRPQMSSVVTVVLALALAASARAGGPPVLAVEMAPAAKGKEAALVVRAVQCGEPLTAELTARAEGVVGGERRTLPLKLRSTKTAGLYEVPRSWPAEGRWVLTFTVDNHGTGTTIVELGPDGLPRRDAKTGAVIQSASSQRPDPAKVQSLLAVSLTN